jgi:hypothetical protein
MDATTGMIAPQISGLIAGAAIPVCAPCYIKQADGKVYPCDGAAADEKAVFAGICPRAANAGEPVTLFGLGTVIKYADETLTPGKKYFIGATGGAGAGGVDTAATTGDAVGFAQAISASAMRITRAI